MMYGAGMGELSQPNLSGQRHQSFTIWAFTKSRRNASQEYSVRGGLAGSCPLGRIWPAQSSPIPAPAILGNNKLKNWKYSSPWEILSKTKEKISKKSFLSNLSFFSQNTKLVFVFKNSLFRKRMHFEMQNLISFNTGFQSTEKNSFPSQKVSHSLTTTTN